MGMLAAVRAGVAEVYTAGDGGAVVSVGVCGVTAFAGSAEEFWVLDGVPKDGAQVVGWRCHGDGAAGEVVAHVQMEGDEVEAVDVLPLVKGAQQGGCVFGVK